VNTEGRVVSVHANSSQLLYMVFNIRELMQFLYHPSCTFLLYHTDSIPSRGKSYCSCWSWREKKIWWCCHGKNFI